MQFQIFFTFILSILNTYNCYDKVTSPNGTTFYFAYGSNLNSKWMHINNPSAVFFNIAELQDHRLDFNRYVPEWQGAGATIVPDNATVWGSVWMVHDDHLHYLDEQEGVEEGNYFAKNVTVTTPNNEKLIARTYQETDYMKLEKNEDNPPARRPSSTYLQVIALGSVESHLPPEYIGFLFSFPTNGKMAIHKRRIELGYPF